ncbi:MAG: ribosome biogenesis GTP-binding protein YihA/YsxC [Ignavibacteria bacterium]|nr:ribosome biogenesis GTP-binding protein YihA/YsxC [Ignavibacteria bacterium]
MKIDFENVRLERTVYTLEQLKTQMLPEIVFMGRSNVGKSSLINKLLNKKNFAKVSQKPGKTRSINFFVVDEKFYLVDLPGFGYASTSKEDSFRFSQLIQDYFRLSKKIILVFHLMDSRVPFTQLDTIARDYVTNLGLDYCILFTKVDKLNQSEKSKLKNQADKLVKSFGFDYFFFSAKTGEGKREVQSFIINRIIESREKKD